MAAGEELAGFHSGLEERRGALPASIREGGEAEPIVEAEGTGFCPPRA